MAAGARQEASRRADWIGRSGSRKLDARATRQSRLVLWARVGLPVIALLLTAVLFAWPYLSPKQDLTIRFEERTGTDDHLRMLKPQFTGTDEQNRDFLITAENAVQEERGSDNVRLDGLKAELTGKNGDWFAMWSKSGVYNEKRGHLEVEGGFSLYTDRGHEVHGETAQADLRESSVVSDRPVRGQGPEGRIMANGFRTEDRGRKLFFLNGVRVVIYQNKEG